MSVDPRRTQPFCTPECYRECRCSRWPDYVNRFGWPVRPGGEEATYIDKVLSYGPIAYWILNETAGAVAADQINSPAQDGTAVGVTWNSIVGPDGVNGAPFFDGVNDYVNIFSAAFAAAFNGATGTVMVWMQVANVGVWTDGTNRYPYYIIGDGNNYYYERRVGAVNNRLSFRGVAGGGSCALTKDGVADTDWVHNVATWSDGANADEYIAYYNGIAVAAACASLNNWNPAGLLGHLIGSASGPPTNPWHGWLAHYAIWDRVLTPAEIADLAIPTG